MITKNPNWRMEWASPVPALNRPRALEPDHSGFVIYAVCVCVCDPKDPKRKPAFMMMVMIAPVLNASSGRLSRANPRSPPPTSEPHYLSIACGQ